MSWIRMVGPFAKNEGFLRGWYAQRSLEMAAGPEVEEPAPEEADPAENDAQVGQGVPCPNCGESDCSCGYKDPATQSR